MALFSLKKRIKKQKYGIKGIIFSGQKRAIGDRIPDRFVLSSRTVAHRPQHSHHAVRRDRLPLHDPRMTVSLQDVDPLGNSLVNKIQLLRATGIH